MDVIRFVATVSENQVIQPLGNVRLPEGMVDVTVVVRPILSAVLPAADAPEPADSVASLGAMLLELAAEAERIAPPLPTDMAMNHDHDAHGKPLP